MKRIFKVFCVTLVTTTILSCEKNVVDMNYLSLDNAYQAGVEYLELENGEYRFSMTESDAAEKNISPWNYKRMVLDVEQTNNAILKMEDNQEILYFDPIHYRETILRSTEYNPTSLIPAPKLIGLIRTNDGYWGYTSFFISDSVSFIELNCNAIGFLQLFNVFVGGQSDSGIGFAGWWKTNIYPKYSNTYATAGFKNSNSSGGICNIIANFKPEILN
ncbi:MAG: hypothetical protein PHS04_12380 [Tissierellia bacterium]|nr:hypothetical protein [Tissierellia bacterium]